MSEQKSMTLWLAGVWSYDAKLFKGERLPVGFPLQLVREPENEHDPNAVAVYVSKAQIAQSRLTLDDLPEKPRYKIGFLPAKMTKINWAKAVAAALDAGEPVECVFGGRGDRAEFSVKITGDCIARVLTELEEIKK